MPINVCSKGHVTGYRHCYYCSPTVVGGEHPTTERVANTTRADRCTPSPVREATRTPIARPPARILPPFKEWRERHRAKRAARRMLDGFTHTSNAAAKFAEALRQLAIAAARAAAKLKAKRANA